MTPRAKIIVGVAWASLLIGLLFVRARLGVCLTDESYYIAMSLRLLHGAAPFTEEMSAHVSSAMLTVPLLWLRQALPPLAAVPVVIFMRMAYVVAAAAAGATVVAVTRRHAGGPRALLMACTVAVFVPWSLPTFSYNSIAALALAVSVFAGAAAVRAPSPKLFMLTGVAIGVMVFAYPTLAVVAAALLVALFRRAGKRSAPLVGITIVCMCVVLAPAALAIARAGLDGIGGFIQLAQSVQTWGGSIRKVIGTGFLAAFAYGAFPLSVLVLSVSLLWWRAGRARAAAWTLVLLPPSMFVRIQLAGPMRATLVVLVIAETVILFSILLARRSGDSPTRPPSVDAVRWMAMPCLLAGAVIGYTSFNGPTAVGIGLVPLAAMLPAVVSDMARMDRAPSLGSSDAYSERRWLTVLAGVSLAGVLVACSFVYVGEDTPASYESAPAWRLDHRVTVGPYEDLITTSRNGLMVEAVYGSLARDVADEDSVLFYPNAPFGYLAYPNRRGTVWPWTSSVLANPAMAAGQSLEWRAMARRGLLPAIVIRRLDGQSAFGAEPLDRLLLGAGYRVVTLRPWYAVLEQSTAR